MDIYTIKKWENKTRLFFSLLSLLPLIGTHAFAHSTTDSLQRFVKSIYTYNYMFPREQVYMHFDNTGYFMGETIWFKAHVVNPDGLKPTAMSRVLYVELLTPEGRIVQQQKLKIEDWNPNVKTDAEGKASVQFYNTPNCKRIEISAEARP